MRRKIRDSLRRLLRKNKLSMRMRAAGAAHAAGSGVAGAGGFGIAVGRRGEDREFFGELFGATMRAFRALPVAGADEQLAVLLTFLAMKLVDGHKPQTKEISRFAGSLASSVSTVCGRPAKTSLNRASESVLEMFTPRDADSMKLRAVCSA